MSRMREYNDEKIKEIKEKGGFSTEFESMINGITKLYEKGFISEYFVDKNKMGVYVSICISKLYPELEEKIFQECNNKKNLYLKRTCSTNLSTDYEIYDVDINKLFDVF